MILVDTSVWVDHLRKGEPALGTLLDATQVLAHPFVIGELALGTLRQRDLILATLQDLPQAVVAIGRKCCDFIDAHAACRGGHRLCRCASACRRRD